MNNVLFSDFDFLSTIIQVALVASHERECRIKAKSGLDFDARTPAGEKRDYHCLPTWWNKADLRQ